MKTWMASLLGMASLAVASPVFAASVGLPAGSTEKRFQATLEYSHIFDRDFEGDPDETSGGGIDQGNQAHVRLSYAIFDWLQPYVQLGASQFDLTDDAIFPGFGPAHVETEFDWAFSWGGGVSGIYRSDEGWFVGYSGEFLTSGNDLDRVTHNGEVGTDIEGEVDFSEWHVAGFVGYTFDLKNVMGLPSELSLYVGGRFSDMEADIDEDIIYDVSAGTFGFTGESESDDNVGVFVGAAFQAGENWRFAVEGRFIDETAVTGQVTFRF